LFHIWEKVDADHSAIRLVTSWATKEDEVLALIEELKK
jgi:threonine aldolase